MKGTTIHRRQVVKMNLEDRDMLNHRYRVLEEQKIKNPTHWLITWQEPIDKSKPAEILLQPIRGSYLTFNTQGDIINAGINIPRENLEHYKEKSPTKDDFHELVDNLMSYGLKGACPDWYHDNAGVVEMNDYIKNEILEAKGQKFYSKLDEYKAPYGKNST